ncbi:MAG: class I SAM-dependent methyltransferase [Chloroflexota bacterium]
MFHPANSPGPVEECQNCRFIFIAHFEDVKSLIFDGPVADASNGDTLLTTSDLDAVADSWEMSLLPSRESEWPALQKNAQSVLTRLDSYIDKPERILDFGCGWGFFLGVAKEHGLTPYGLEPLPAHAVHARAKFGATVVTDTLRQDTFQPEFFDIITAFQVFEHLPYPNTDLAQLHNFLKPGGLILIEVPNIETWSVHLLRGRHRHFVPDHVNFFSTHSLSRLLETNGFDVMETFYPTRSMSLRHLMNFWGRQYLPNPLVNQVERISRRLRLWERSISVNLGDIVTVIGRKV